ncbi:MAG: PEGA domain-containing protein [Melioribacteraceae bacterium]|nr:PEGA domain-containing protein [Melioribacteraceae bacterium]
MKYFISINKFLCKEKQYHFMNKKVFLVVITIFALAFNACSTFMNSTTQEINIKTEPANAKITIDGKKFGTTPQVVNIERGSNHVVKLEADGFDAYEMQVTRKISFWFWGNVLNGIIPGMLIDMVTGAMYNLLPEDVEVSLQLTPKPEKPLKK